MHTYLLILAPASTHACLQNYTRCATAPTSTLRSLTCAAKQTRPSNLEAETDLLRARQALVSNRSRLPIVIVAAAHEIHYARLLRFLRWGRLLGLSLELGLGFAALCCCFGCL